ncbi:nucleotidyltransferase domain-containing protein [Dyella sp. GSA-30]|uniref:DNA polymerase beta superfamily protein n=1 Tax=Dyella sp. GSA-30 TaxID=2994496 RepID=UPI00249084CF|nr:nucleotidyltransferase domain-containing protein [Dyella sp. GSA-30]
MYSLESLLAHDAPALLFECIGGSHAYGTATAESDRDIRGIFAVPGHAYMALNAPTNQVADARNDIVFYSLRRVVELLTGANPNVLELLFMPADCVRWTSPEMQALVEHRHLFISRQCVQTHLGYAISQIKKARGQNKWVNQPRAERPPAKEDFCHIVPREHLLPAGQPACRPVPLPTLQWNLAEYHVSRLEHARDGYRLYRYGAQARGVFREDMIACESIPLEHESSHFSGLLFFNEQAWKQALVDHQNYWIWRRERNEERWRQQESGELDYDAKNLMHTIRLLLSGESILTRGEPMIRFEGERLQLLMDIRHGRFQYDEIMAMAQDISERCEKHMNTDLPPAIDALAADRLLQQLTTQWEARQV